ncbi:MAG: hypothetical protein GY952_15235 [Rhodobacteraceae bacterium]|nr:hypothetical protein [Paracoccaceae bacterium]
MHIWQTCKGKRIGGFFLHHGRFYTGFLVGKARQIITLIEKMIRLRWIDRVNVVHERAIGSGVVPGWFEGGLNISDLPPDQAAQVPGLAQLIANEIKARRGN